MAHSFGSPCLHGGTYRKGVSNARVLVKFGWTGDDEAYQPDDR